MSYSDNMSYSDDELRAAVRERYGGAARRGAACCDGGPCAERPGVAAGYDIDELQSVTAEADLGLGCGTPLAAAQVVSGEIVVDLGSGGGLDCLLAASLVGEQGSAIGVDMTPEMVDRARRAAERMEALNVSFRLGEIEALPVADRSADVVISNCVINLSPDKRAVLREAFRVLKPGGRLAVADILASRAPRAQERADLELYAACVSGAEEAETMRELLSSVGFEEVMIESRPSPACAGDGASPVPVYSATLGARKPTR
jgi:SAM-dependent methyltransferase